MTIRKISWGTRIAILYGGFVVLIVMLVWGSMRQHFDLVSKDYYEQELKYQEVIDAHKNQAALSAPVAFRAAPERIVLLFPAECAEQGISGTVSFYAPVDGRWDRTVNVETRHSAFVIPRGQLHPTKYIMKISWTSGGKKYYQESDLNLYRP